MAIKLEKVETLMNDATKNIVADEGLWKTFLNTSSYMYKYSFTNQMAIYAQRADATACTDYASWNKLERFVRKGSKGIRLVEESPYIESDFVFDVSCTENLKNKNRKLRLWEISQSQFSLIEKSLDENFELESKEFIDKLAEAVKFSVMDNIIDFMDNFLANNSDSETVHTDSDKLWKLATNSAIYIVFKRCNLLPVPDEYNNIDLSVISEYESFDDLSDFGVVIREAASNILTEIERNVKKDIAKQVQLTYNDKRRSETERRSSDEIDIQTRGGLSNPEPRTTTSTRGGSGEIRTNEETLSDGEQEGIVFPSIGSRDTQTTLNGDRSAGLGNENTSSERDAGERQRANEGRRSDGVGTTPEYDYTSSGGDYPERSDIQLSIFSTEEEQKQTIENNIGADNTAPFSLEKKEELIDYIINTNYSKVNGKSRIASMIVTQHNDIAIMRVARENMQGGKGIVFDGEKYALWTDENGIRYCKGNNARYNPASQVITWPEVLQWIKDDLYESTYLTNFELDNLMNLEKSELAEKIDFLYSDLSDEAKENNYLASVKNIKQNTSPKVQSSLIELMNDEKTLSRLRGDILDFQQALKVNNDLLRFHYHKIGEIVQSINMLFMDRVPFVSEKAISEEATVEKFITDDEIDAELLKGTHYQNGRTTIYNGYMNTASEEPFSTFLKKAYGDGGYGAFNEIGGMFNSKGIKYAKTGCEPIILSWEKVAKRFSYLIDNGLFPLPEAELTLTNNEPEKDKTELEATNLISNEITTEPEKDKTELKIRVEWSESPAFYEDVENGNNVYSFAMMNNLLDVLDEMQSKEVGYDKTKLVIEGVLNGEEYSYTFRFDIGDNIGSLFEQLQTSMINPDVLKYFEDNTMLSPEEAIDITDKYEIVVNAYKNSMESEITDEEPPKTNNFIISDNELGVGTSKEKLDNNILAIKTLKTIESEDRNATPDEQQILSNYVGWGGLADAFDERKNLYNAELKTLLTDDEYNSAMESVLNAHYTAPIIIEGIYKALENFGFNGGNILEPSCGTGNFFGKMPEEMFKNSNIEGVELDSISGRIAQQLYPDAHISIKGYEETAFADNTFDVAIGNVPFGNYGVADKKYDKNSFKIHDYFFAKTLDQVRPNGVVAFITSKGTLDKKSNQVRKYIGERAEFLGAIRLPNTAFKKNAGTEVTSDIIFLQKRERPIICEDEWLNLGIDENGYSYNEYFIEHPEMVIGEMKEVSGPFGPELTCELENPNDLQEKLNVAVNNIKGYIAEVEYDELEEDADDNVIVADPTCPNYSYAIIDDKVYFRENSIMTLSSKNATALERIKGLIEVKNATKELIDAQTNDASNEEIEALQGNLNVVYDEFTDKYGLINSRGNDLAFREDSSYPLICSLEKVDEDGKLISKADMFTKRTIKVKNIIEHVDEAREALALSLSEKGRVDIDYMCQLTNKEKQEILDDLTGIVYRVPDIHDPDKEVYQTASEYLSGNIRTKISYATLLVDRFPEYNINLEALNSVMPKPLDASEIDIRLGATWLPVEYYNDFMSEVLETPQWMIDREIIKVSYSDITSNWNISGKSNDRGSVAASVTYGTERANAYRILEDALNLRSVRITDTIIDEAGNERVVTNAKETTLANQKQDLIKEKFKEWIWQDAERREDLCSIYNEKFNSNVTREYDGSFLEFPNMNISISLKEHQKRAVARQIYGGNTLLAHCVGAGKTYEMAAAVMEKKRLGLANKAMLVVPNHLTGQWASEFMELYPNANVLAVTKRDFQPMNRKKFCSRIATGDYDAIIIGHSQFEMIPLSKERQVEFIENQIEDIVNAINEERYESGRSFTVKQLKKLEKELRTKLKKLNDASRKDNVIDFEQLGIDFLCVDEAHSFKNLALQTKMRNVAGIQTTGANKSYDMFAKCVYMDEITNGKGITFATGTPISNSMSELYTLQKYLQYNKLRSMNMVNFDAWASTFGETTTSYELSPEGTGYRQKSRFSKFFNLPELMSSFKEVADIQTADMIKLDVPDATTETVVLKPSSLQKALLENLATRAEKVRNNGVDPSEDNMLKITTDGRKLALDEQLYGELPKDIEYNETEPQHKTKVDAVVEKCMYHYNQTMEEKSAQLIFCDLATPKKDGSFSIYDEIKSQLLEQGVDETEIAYIHDANTDVKKTELFSKVRQGKVRFLLGSTSKMGAGMNVQNKLIALHHVDVPWKPSDIEQREGRIIRQGNENKEVHIYRYVTENTFDAYSWQLIENKQKFIGQIMTSKSPVRSCDDIDEVALTYAEVKALATGNPYIKEKMELDNEVSRLKVMKGNFLSERYRLQDDLLKKLPAELLNANKMVEGLKSDIEYSKDYPVADAENFKIKIGQVTVDNKKDAGFAIIDAGVKCKSYNNEMELGEYRGFSMKVRNSLDGPYLTLSHNVNLNCSIGDDPVGMITRMNNLIDNLPEKLDTFIKKVEQTEKQMQNATIELEKPFTKEEELKQKIERLKELDLLLAEDKDKSTTTETDKPKMPELEKTDEGRRTCDNSKSFPYSSKDKY